MGVVSEKGEEPNSRDRARSGASDTARRPLSTRGARTRGEGGAIRRDAFLSKLSSHPRCGHLNGFITVHPRCTLLDYERRLAKARGGGVSLCPP